MPKRSRHDEESRSEAQRLQDFKLSEPDLFRIIGTFREPAFLVTSKGNVLYANESARSQFETPPLWLQSVVRLPDSKIFDRFCNTCSIRLDSVQLYLILPTADVGPILPEETGRSEGIVDALPPSLARVASLLMLGLSDKKISECTELSLASVRTYTSRIYRRLDITGRQELLALALAETNKG